MMEKREFLYKFMPLDKHALLTLFKHELYFADPSKLNDPIDCLHNIKINNFPKLDEDSVISLVEKNRLYIGPDDEFPDEQIARYLLGDDQHLLDLILFLIKKKAREKIGVCSFSRDWKDQRLWSHYSDSTKGICIIFDKDILVQKLELNTERQDSQFRRFYGDDVNYNDQPYEVEIINGDFQLKKDYYFKKTNVWVYEKEYRLVLFSDIGMNNYADYEKNRYYIFPVEAVVGVILGENTTSYDMFTIKDIKTHLNLKFVVRNIYRDIRTGEIRVIENVR